MLPQIFQTTKKWPTPHTTKAPFTNSSKASIQRFDYIQNDWMMFYETITLSDIQLKATKTTSITE